VGLWIVRQDKWSTCPSNVVYLETSKVMFHCTGFNGYNRHTKSKSCRAQLLCVPSTRGATYLVLHYPTQDLNILKSLARNLSRRREIMLHLWCPSGRPRTLSSRSVTPHDLIRSGTPSSRQARQNTQFPHAHILKTNASIAAPPSHRHHARTNHEAATCSVCLNRGRAGPQVYPHRSWHSGKEENNDR
jgi:hypothetical protein